MEFNPDLSADLQPQMNNGETSGQPIEPTQTTSRAIETFASGTVESSLPKVEKTRPPAFKFTPYEGTSVYDPNVFRNNGRAGTEMSSNTAGGTQPPVETAPDQPALLGSPVEGISWSLQPFYQRQEGYTETNPVYDPNVFRNNGSTGTEMSSNTARETPPPVEGMASTGSLGSALDQPALLGSPVEGIPWSFTPFSQRQDGHAVAPPVYDPNVFRNIWRLGTDMSSNTARGTQPPVEGISGLNQPALLGSPVEGIPGSSKPLDQRQDGHAGASPFSKDSLPCISPMQANSGLSAPLGEGSAANTEILQQGEYPFIQDEQASPESLRGSSLRVTPKIKELAGLYNKQAQALQAGQESAECLYPDNMIETMECVAGKDLSALRQFQVQMICVLQNMNIQWKNALDILSQLVEENLVSPTEKIADGRLVSGTRVVFKIAAWRQHTPLSILEAHTLITEKIQGIRLLINNVHKVLAKINVQTENIEQIQDGSSDVNVLWMLKNMPKEKNEMARNIMYKELAVGNVQLDDWPKTLSLKELLDEIINMVKKYSNNKIAQEKVIRTILTELDRFLIAIESRKEFSTSQKKPLKVGEILDKIRISNN